MKEYKNMTTRESRFPAEVSIFEMIPDLKTLVNMFDDYQALDSTLVLRKVDQQEPLQLTIKDLYQPNNNQSSEAPVSETKTGLEGSGTISLSREGDRDRLLQVAFNSRYTPGNVEGDPGLHEISDNAGLTVGLCDELPFRITVIRPYGCGETVLANPKNWFIFPWTLYKSDANPSFGLGTQFGYTIMFTAFGNPETGKHKLLRGNTQHLSEVEYPTV